MTLIAENISKRYLRKAGNTNILDAVRPLSLTLEPGSVTMLTGRSGSGKTTLLHMLAGLLPPDSGRVLLGGTDLYAGNDAARARLRARRIAVVPQARSLLDSLTVLENVLLPALLTGQKGALLPEADARARLSDLRILPLADERPAALSGGELRRAAVARALLQDAPVLLADEPTGDLDDESAQAVLRTLAAAAREDGKAVFIVTHESAAFPFADRLFRMDAGVLSPFAPSGAA